MHSMKKFFLFLALSAALYSEDVPYRFEGIYSDDGDRRFFLMAYYLPYNPNIIGFSSNPGQPRSCEKWWPNGSFRTLDLFQSPDPRMPCDFLWIEGEGEEQQILEQNGSLLGLARVIYTTTHLENGGASYKNLKAFLEARSFKLLSHWFWEGKSGHAIFVKRELVDTAMKTLNYPSPISWESAPDPIDLKRFLKKAENKPRGHSYEGIDYIYMINLDERPDKFFRTAFNLQLYGIDPYRFSAFNGWKLTVPDLDELGVKLLPGTFKDLFMGSRFVGQGERVFTTNEFLKQDGGSWFTIGMSRGAVGIVLSHLSILQDALDSGYRTIWVMEDDVEVVSDPQAIPRLIRELDRLIGDWDILFTDIDTKDTSGRHVPCRAMAARPNFRSEPIHHLFERFYSVNNEISRVGMRYGAYSMIIRRSGMMKILSYYKNYRIYLPYDIDFWMIPELKMYSASFDIVSHRAGSPSDNSFPNYLDQ